MHGTMRCSCTACPRIAARRWPPTSSTARRASSGTRPRTGCTRKRRCSNTWSAGASKRHEAFSTMTSIGMGETMMKRITAIACMALTLLVAPGAGAQTWPDKPIRFLMSAPAGSSIADKLRDRLGQPVVVENKPAAGGTVATAEVAHSAPDGYTMVLAFNGPLSFAPLLQKLPYDVAKDLAPVIITSSQPNVLAVNASLPVQSVKDLVAYAKANPGKLNYAS